jgi:hypothetical protein
MINPLLIIESPLLMTLTVIVSPVSGILLIIFILRLEFLGNDHDFCENLFELFDMDPKLVFLVQVIDLIKTVMARNNHKCGARSPNLLRFDLAGLHSPALEGRPHGDEASTAATAVVVLMVGLHLNEIVCDVADDLSAESGQIAVSGEVAGVLISDPFFEFLLRIDLDAAFAQILCEKLERVKDGNRRLTVGIP